VLGSDGIEMGHYAQSQAIRSTLFATAMKAIPELIGPQCFGRRSAFRDRAMIIDLCVGRSKGYFYIERDMACDERSKTIAQCRERGSGQWYLGLL